MKKEQSNQGNELSFRSEDIQYELEGINDILTLLETEDNEIISLHADPLQGRATKVMVPLEVASEFASRLRDYYSGKLKEVEK
jgi:hypothetical protein